MGAELRASLPLGKSAAKNSLENLHHNFEEISVYDRCTTTTNKTEFTIGV